MNYNLRTQMAEPEVEDRLQRGLREGLAGLVTATTILAISAEAWFNNSNSTNAQQAACALYFASIGLGLCSCANIGEAAYLKFGQIMSEMRSMSAE
jgi:hypothetical protein